MSRNLGFLLGFCLVALVAFVADARAVNGSYVIEGGTAYEQSQVRSALQASAFDWNLVPATIAIHVVRDGDSYATEGEIWLSGTLLDAGRFSWGTVQHEYAHQVDYYLFDDGIRASLISLLGGRTWWSVPGAPHDRLGSERFASTLAWAYWPSPSNAMKPQSRHDESAALPAADFRALLSGTLGVPDRAPRALTGR